MRLTKKSASGRKARPPRWWGEFVDSVPQFSIPGLRPNTWTPELAQKWLKAVPPKCPFERQWWWGENLVLYVPALCSLNPLSTQLYSIRLEALAFVTDRKQT